MFKNLREKLTGVPSLDSILDEVPRHFDRFVGQADNVFHEIVSDALHIDVHHIPPAGNRPYHTIYTTGMSMRAMPAKPGQIPLAELFMMLPPDWKFSQEDFQEPANYWPIETIKRMARLPHDMRVCMTPFISTQFTDPASPVPGTDFYGVMFTPPEFWPPAAQRVKTQSGTTIQLYALMPLTLKEMDFKARQPSPDAFWHYIRQSGHDPAHMCIADPKRPSIV